MACRVPDRDPPTVECSIDRVLLSPPAASQPDFDSARSEPPLHDWKRSPANLGHSSYTTFKQPEKKSGFPTLAMFPTFRRRELQLALGRNSSAFYPSDIMTAICSDSAGFAAGRRIEAELRKLRYHAARPRTSRPRRFARFLR